MHVMLSTTTHQTSTWNMWQNHLGLPHKHIHVRNELSPQITLGQYIYGTKQEYMQRTHRMLDIPCLCHQSKRVWCDGASGQWQRWCLVHSLPPASCKLHVLNVAHVVAPVCVCVWVCVCVCVRVCVHVCVCACVYVCVTEQLWALRMHTMCEGVTKPLV